MDQIITFQHLVYNGLYQESLLCGSLFLTITRIQILPFEQKRRNFYYIFMGGILMNILAKRIKELRQDSGLSQKELSYILNIERTTLTGYETGRRMPDAEMLCRIADYFHVSVDFLIGHEGDPNCSS